MLNIMILAMTILAMNSMKKATMMINMQMVFLMTILMMPFLKLTISPQLFVNIVMSINSMNVALMLLSLWVIALMFLVSMKYETMNNNPKMFNLSLILLLVVLVIFFTTDNLLILYIMFETSLIPTVLLILKWGYQPERLQATFYFVMYTVCASLPLLVMISKMKVQNFSFSMYSFSPMYTFNEMFSFYTIYLSMIIAFLVKVPMWGAHLWLPKAHVEAPVSGSMILAGVLLKLGGYGLLKILMLNYKMTLCNINILYSINIWGTIIVSIVCITSSDMKKLIAYSSIVHMAMMIIGILKNNTMALMGAMMMMLAHGVSSPGLFALANMNYESTQTRNIMLQKGIATTQPLTTAAWFILLAANMAAPPSLNLASEILIFMSALKISLIMVLMLCVVTFLSAGYNLYLYSAQQSNSITFITPNLSVSSNSILTSILHFVPVYMTFMIIPLMF